MNSLIARYRAREDGDGDESGFTLIELLIVIVVLGVLAAVTVFALSSITGKSAAAACNSDAASVNTALAAYNANPPTYTVANPAPTLAADWAAALSPTYLATFPSNGSHYTITVTGSGRAAVVNVAAPSTATSAVWTPGSTACANAS